MTSSTLTPENLPAGPDRRVHQGHGTAALGPSDSSDSGSDVRSPNAAAALGDEDLDSDSDSGGTGERASVEGDGDADDGADIRADRIERIPGEDDEPDH